MGKHTDELGKFEDFQAPWESATGSDQELDPPKLKKFLFNLLSDKAKAQDARDESAEKVVETEKTLKEAKDEVAKGDPTGKIADLEKKLEKATGDLDKSQLNLVRLEVAVEKELTPKQAKRLQGTTKEELEADADELLQEFGVSAKKDPDDEEDEDEDEEAETLRRTPRNLSNPADPKNGANAEPDYDAIADAAVRGSRVHI